MKLSIVTTLFHSALYIKEFYTKISLSAKKITPDFEIIFVNDGSPDKSLELCLEMHKKDPQVTVIDLSKNFGHHKAMMTGIKIAKGDFVFLIDSDLEENPNLLEVFYEELQQNPTVDVVYGVQRKRKGSISEKLFGNIYYSLFSYLTDNAVPSKNISTVRLMRAPYVKNIITYQESELMLFALFHAAGFNQKAYLIDKGYKKSTSYTFKRKFLLFINGLTSFSQKPLIGIFFAGMLITFFSFAVAFITLIRYICFGVSVSGWVSLIISMWCLGGITIFFLGIIAIYMAIMFLEVKRRPFPFIKNIYGLDNEKK